MFSFTVHSAVHFTQHSVAGEITILPRLASTMEVVAAREDDALVIVCPAPSPSPDPVDGSL